MSLTASLIVALRKESVDRNSTELASFRAYTMSLSARRAWIEIEAGSVRGISSRSLSARRAWIEILHTSHDSPAPKSLSARRAWIEIMIHHTKKEINPASLSARRAWIEISKNLTA